jgi:hypothetical protein
VRSLPHEEIEVFQLQFVSPGFYKHLDVAVEIEGGKLIAIELDTNHPALEVKEVVRSIEKDDL